LHPIFGYGNVNKCLHENKFSTTPTEIGDELAEIKSELTNAHSNLMSVAKQAGVSAMTVSRVLNHPGKVADTTREKVQEVIDSLGYVPNFAANTLRRKRSGVVVAMVPTIDYSVFSDTIQGISDVLELAGYQLLLGCASYSPEKEQALMKAFLGHRPDGIILTGTLHTPETRKMLIQTGVPIVEMWDNSDDHLDMAVGFDNFRAGHEITRHMIDYGYTNIGYIGGNPKHEANENRAAKRSKGLYAAFQDAKLSKPVRWNVLDPLNVSECGIIAADFVMENPDLDAIICANEIIGVGAIRELQRRGKSVPNDIAISGIGDANIAALVSPGLTTIRFHGRSIGQRSAELLLGRLNNLDFTEDRVDIGFELVLRGSTSFEKPWN
jgi:LacI family gluconate utilization system Gnt-I transcriptional repressor